MKKAILVFSSLFILGVAQATQSFSSIAVNITSQPKSTITYGKHFADFENLDWCGNELRVHPRKSDKPFFLFEEPPSRNPDLVRKFFKGGLKSEVQHPPALLNG